MKLNVFALLLLFVLFFASCAANRAGSGGKKGCGCPSKKGLVGY
jgi:hypothetical protein